MIESIKLRDFRGIKTGSIEGFRKINLLVGPNNSGKSAVLEAIYMACANSRKASLTIEEYGSTYFVAAIAETDLLGDHPMHRVLAKHNYSKRLEDLSDYEPGKISVQQTNQKIALPIFDLTSFGKFQNGDEIHAATFGLELQDPDEPSDKNRIAEIQQRLLNLLKNAEPLETLIHELEDKKRDAPAELERDVEDQKLFSEIDKEIAELDERLNPIRSQQRELNRQTEDISKALSERQEKIRRLAKSLMKPIEDGFTEGRLLYCWHPRLSYKYKGDAAWIVKGKIPSAPRTIFYDVSKVTGYISWDFIQLNLMRETGWLQRIGNSFGRVLYPRPNPKPCMVQFQPSSEDSTLAQGWVSVGTEPFIQIDAFGDGARSIFKLLVALHTLIDLVGDKKPGILIWEEPELFQNPKTLDPLMKEIISLLEGHPIQLFISSHSLESIADLVSEELLKPEDFRAIRTKLESGKLSTFVFNLENLKDALDLGIDPRLWGDSELPLQFIYREETGGSNNV